MRGLLVCGLIAGMACGIADQGKLPPDVLDPTTIRNPNGAMALYTEAIGQLGRVVEGVVRASGIISDELAALPIPLSTEAPYTNLDSRQKPSFPPNYFHRLRAQAHEARAFLEAFAPDSSPALRAHMYSLEGYAEIFLADLFCSGIPLSKVNFEGNYTLAAGSTTLEVYRHALALFDTALTLGSDSVRIRDLAALGKGRSLLALGDYDLAAAAVAGVPDDYRYQVPAQWTSNGGVFDNSTFGVLPPDTLALMWYWSRSTSSSHNSHRRGAPSVADLEGGRGLNYLTSGDPRVKATATGQDQTGNILYRPSKYGTSTPVQLTPASGIEARLIEAEAALQAGSGDWLIKLNALRQSPAACGTIVPATTCPLSMLEDPGASLSDPKAAKDARVDLLFRERAFWLYLAGYRQGDLRRLIRQYSRDPNTVYPIGPYPGGSNNQYGERIVIPIPDEERQLNSMYTGCFNMNA